jgi:ATP-dependent protease ClpP protease subunit
MINIIGEISNESYLDFHLALTKFEKDQKRKTLDIQIVSEGGDAYAALAYYDRIRRSQLTLTTIATGLVASAASLIFVAGKIRYMTPNAWLMVHEDSLSGIEDLKVYQVEKEAIRGRRLENQWCNLMTEATGIPVNIWAKLHKKETYLSAKKCLEMGIIGGIK